jgi:cbb3-type cytochrome oxidase subunit 3
MIFKTFMAMIIFAVIVAILRPKQKLSAREALYLIIIFISAGVVVNVITFVAGV